MVDEINTLGSPSFTKEATNSSGIAFCEFRLESYGWLFYLFLCFFEIEGALSGSMIENLICRETPFAFYFPYTVFFGTDIREIFSLECFGSSSFASLSGWHLGNGHCF